MREFGIRHEQENGTVMWAGTEEFVWSREPVWMSAEQVLDQLASRAAFRPGLSLALGTITQLVERTVSSVVVY